MDAVSEDAIDDAMRRGSLAMDTGAFDDARGAYEEAESLLSHEYGPRRAEVLACLAALARADARVDDATALLDRALAVFPRHRSALAMRLEVARAAGDHPTATGLAARMVDLAETDEERVAALGGLTAEALASAAGAIEHALGVRGPDRGLFALLRTVRDAADDVVGAVNAAVSVAEATVDPRERAQAFVAAADLCATRARNVDRAVALYEAAIADDPATRGAFEAIESVLAESGDHQALAAAYERQLERLLGASETSAAAALLQKLAALREGALGDLPAAIAALDRLCSIAPDDVEARARLADLLERVGDDGLAVRCLETAAERAPARVATFRALRGLFVRAGATDRAFAACAVLVHLGEAETDEQLAYQQHAPQATLSPTRALAPDDWLPLLHESHDADVATLITLIAPAARAIRLEQLRAAQRLSPLDPKERQDPEKTTVTAVRTVLWASRVLGVPLPEIHVRAQDPGGLAMAAAATPALVLGRGILSGRAVPELAFAFARELAFHQATMHLVPLFPTLGDLRSLVVAAMAVVMPEVTAQGEVGVLREGLSARLSPAAHRELAVAVRTLTARGGALDLSRWLRASELLACRAGLVACGDLCAGARMLALDGRAAFGLSGAARTRALVPFSIGSAYADVRAALGVAVR